MQTVTTIGLDIAKSVFQVHGVDAAGQAVIRRKVKRRYVLAFFQFSGPPRYPHGPRPPDAWAGLLSDTGRTQNTRRRALFRPSYAIA
jgi:hypothetical protein